MQKALRTPTILLVCFVLLFVGYILYTTYVPSDTADTEQDLLSVSSDEIQSVAIQYDEIDIFLEREGEIWTMRRPREGEVRSERVEDLLTELDALVSSEMPLEGIPDDRLDEYGLSDPDAIITLMRRDASSVSVFVGDVDFTGDSVFVRVSDSDKIYLVPSSLPFRVKLDPEGLIKVESVPETE